MRFLTPFLSLVGVLLAIAMITFAIATALPGDTAEIRVGKRDDLTFEQRAELVAAERERLGLDQPVPWQFVIWLGKAVQGDLGVQEGGGSVGKAVLERIIPSLELAFLTLAVSLPLAALLALRSVRRGKRVFSVVAGQLSTVGFVVPQFWLGILFVIFFAVLLGWLPASGYESFRELPVEHVRRVIMPLITLVIPTTAVFFHFMRQSLREALGTQYIRTARAKGLSETSVLYQHAFPNALLPSLTVLGVQFGQLLGGVVVVERIFNWPGVGGLLIYSVERQDFSTLIACVMAIAAAYVLMSTLIEIAYRVVDPRIRRA
ncbi:ABC transporter permease, partial [Gaiella sp.]|uniref:ABC transporter permease n=1 Tax=Gaiella sp. TaxID=2663207 RepID=UPI003266629C